MRCILANVVITLLLVSHGAAAAGASVEWVVTSNTLEWPEVHFLFKNDSSEKMKFLVGVPSQLECTGGGAKHQYRLSPDNFWPTSTGEEAASRGSIPPFGWNHRTFRLGSDFELREHLPCTLQAMVEFVGDTRTTQEVDVNLPLNVIPRAWEQPEFGTLISDFVVESDGQVLLLRILLRNSLDMGITVEELSREIVCPSSNQKLAEWGLSSVLRQGESGPLYVEANSWGVLMEAVRVKDTRAMEECEAHIVLGSGDVAWEEITIPLQPKSEMLPFFSKHWSPLPPK